MHQLRTSHSATIASINIYRGIYDLRLGDKELRHSQVDIHSDEGSLDLDTASDLVFPHMVFTQFHFGSVTIRLPRQARGLMVKLSVHNMGQCTGAVLQ